VKLKRLIVQGFKSFKDRTIINFDDGITGIVGPNGCGKSNIVDALFWVMGEMSAKHLRGNSMKDVIFAGSDKYSPASFAEVTLVLGNEGGKHIHIGSTVCSPTEIQLTRKLYRNGDTEYRINDNPCRLKDIQEVFMDTGAGAKSYSIIAQGEINRLVQAKPEERRIMIEEVAGITKFKIRKRDSLKKIEQTQQNLGRLSDLIVEIEKNLKSLEKQAEKAERAKHLRERVKNNELVVESHKVFEFMRDIKESNRNIELKKSDVERWATRKNVLEIDLEEERIQKDDQTEKIEDFQKEFNVLSKTLAQAEERLRYLGKSAEEKQKQLEQRLKESQEIAAELKNREERLQSLEQEKTDHAKKAELGFDYADLEEKVALLKEQLQDKEEELSNLSKDSQGIKEQFVTADQEVFKNNSRLTELAANLRDLTQEIEVLEKQYSSVNGQIQSERDEVRTLDTKLADLSVQEQQLKVDLIDIEETLKKYEAKYRESYNEFIKVDSRLQSLKELNNSFEGMKQGLQKFLDAKEGADHQVLGKLIRCEDKYTVAVQSLLGDVLEHVVAENSESFIEWCSAHSSEILDGLVLKNTGSISKEALDRIKLNAGESIIPLMDVLEVPQNLQEFFTSLTAGLFVGENLNVEVVNTLSTDLKFRAICDVNGRVLFKNHGNHIGLSMNVESRGGISIVDRNNKIQALELEFAALSEETTRLDETVKTFNEQALAKRESYEVLREEISASKTTYAGKKSAMDSKLSGHEAGQTRLSILQNRKLETSRSRLELLEKEELIAKKKSELEDKLQNGENHLHDLKDVVENLRSQYTDERDDLMAKSLEAKTFEDRLKSFNSQISDVANQVDRLVSKVDSNKNLMEQLSNDLNQLDIDIATLKDENKLSAINLSEKEEMLNLMKDRLVELLTGMQEREAEAKELNSKVNKTEKELVEIELKIDQHLIAEEQVSRNVFEKFQIDLRSAVATEAEYIAADFDVLKDISSIFSQETEDGRTKVATEDYEFRRRYGQDLKDCSVKLRDYRSELNRLGEINWQAIEDYDRQKLRFDFLRSQEEELKKSLMDLQTAIGHIDEKCKERFKVAFEEVSTRFEKVFPIIFGGGNAKLQVIGDLDDAECGVDIIAQPPGKKMQNINLMSGGEKAMTAVSLIFSIFLVKPSPFCLLDEVDAPLDDANVGRFNELLREMSSESQFILITHNKKTMELNDMLYGITMQEPGISKAVSVQLH